MNNFYKRIERIYKTLKKLWEAQKTLKIREIVRMDDGSYMWEAGVYTYDNYVSVGKDFVMSYNFNLQFNRNTLRGVVTPWKNNLALTNYCTEEVCAALDYMEEQLEEVGSKLFNELGKLSEQETHTENLEHKLRFI